MYHTTKNWDRILISDMTDSHLVNIIKWIDNHAENWLVIWDVSWDADERWADVLGWDEARDYLNYDSYIEEAKKRNFNF